MPNACPSEEDVACFIEGRASASTVQSILEHLDSCTECRILLANALRGFDTTPRAGGAGGLPKTFSVGAVIGGRYRIDRFMSRGGMGEVYAAWDLELDEAVALKTIVCTGLDSSGLAGRLRAEVQLARRVTHPNVCRILEFGVHRRRYREQDESIPFFTMELLSGVTLAAYIARKGRLSEREAIRIASQVLAGLDAIHSAGIVHRDLKPQNVFIEPSQDAEPRAIVMDFGLARRADAMDWSTSSTGGGPAGTPAYMAPEQGLGVTPSPAWDIYAFGVLLFELLAGKLPFRVETEAGVALARRDEAAPPLSSVLSGVHPALEAIVARCLEREPSRRFAAGSEILRALSVIPRRPRPNHGSYWLLPLAALVVIGLAAWWSASSPGTSAPTSPEPTNARRGPPAHAAAPEMGDSVRSEPGRGSSTPSAQPTPISSAAAGANENEPGGQDPARTQGPSTGGSVVSPRARRGAVSAVAAQRADSRGPTAATQISAPPADAGDDDLAIPSFVRSPAVRRSVEP
ncbi:MAG: protein kinase [Polyangiaceae bacterium]|nr:protein kinase [Polyangiaceae bacterium]